MQLKVTLNSLLNYLETHHYKPQIQKENEQICIFFKSFNAEFAIFIRLLDQGEIVQIVVYLPMQIQENAMNDTARLLHKINHDIDSPGFCLQEHSRLVFYRIVIPSPGKILDTDLLDRYLKLAPKVSASFYSLISSVADGSKTFDTILEKG